LLDPEVVLLDCSLNSATSELKSVEFDLNKKRGHLEKKKFGHRVNQKVATGKRLQWLQRRGPPRERHLSAAVARLGDLRR
jgi:hypothetical protein